MFKIYDLNMKELPFPEGVKPLDIFVSSVNKRRLTEEIEGRSGTLNYGYDYGERSVDLSLWLEAHDTIDYRLIRNELYAFFDTHDVFYIEETRLPSRVLKVTIDESYIPERINQTHSSVEISCRTLDSVFWETKYTTLELHDSGYSALVEKYGLVDNIDVEKVKYRFSPDIETRDLSNIRFAYGLISGTGAITTSQAYSYSTEFIKLTQEIEYTFEDKGTNPRLSYWWFAVYDDDGNFIERFSSSNNPNPRIHKFVAKGSNLRIMTNAVTPLADNVIRPEEIGVDVLPTISWQAKKTTFTVYNAGNVAVEPESMELHIRFRNAKNLGEIKLVNRTTGETFSTTADVGLTRHFEINGMVVKSGAKNIFRDTNRRFIRLAPGINEFDFSGATFDSLDFNFKYLYK